MDEHIKVSLLNKARTHLERVSAKIFETKTRIDNSIVQLRKELIKARGEERDTKEVLLYHHLDTQRNMEQQHESPYFVRCDVLFDDETDERTLYFGKFPYTTESIYSWVTPASVIRFESPGRFAYETPHGEKRSGQLLRKDQFMIVNGKILFMSSESTDIPRELIYQEYFSQKKSEFSLREIVEQMEKAQDTIIRSHYFGSFLISGPAGSGKTTLALHRAAYLIQSPDTAQLFPPKRVIIFVHDDTTKKYFSQLLPQLGIHKVTITTFSEWAMQILGLQEYRYIFRFGRSEQEKDSYEYQKNKALKNANLHRHSLERGNSGGNCYKTLEKLYSNYFSQEHMLLFKSQAQKQLLDRFDLTILLKIMIAEKGQIVETVDRYVKQLNGKYVKKIFQQPLNYALIVLDEAENYLVEQIAVMKHAVDPKTNGIIYVGDLVQKTLPFTISEWEEVNEVFQSERKIVLQKVYRNTQQILEYIASLGYAVHIPPHAKQGVSVHERIAVSKQEELQKVIEVVKEQHDRITGVLAKTEEYLREYKKQLINYPNVHVLTINEAQGVEFDTVIIVGINKRLFDSSGLPEFLQTERKRVDRDLLYVAMTRAMNELYIFGNTQIKEII